MEVVKNIAAILGVILSAASVLTLCSKTVRSFVLKILKKRKEQDELQKSIAEIKEMLERHIEEEKEFKDNLAEMNEINLEFTKEQCRNIIKGIFYRYSDTQTLPLYEKKALKSVEDLYVNRLNGNSYAALLLDEMKDWEIDYKSAHPGEED